MGGKEWKKLEKPCTSLLEWLGENWSLVILWEDEVKTYHKSYAPPRKSCLRWKKIWCTRNAFVFRSEKFVVRNFVRYVFLLGETQCKLAWMANCMQLKVASILSNFTMTSLWMILFSWFFKSTKSYVKVMQSNTSGNLLLPSPPMLCSLSTL